MFGVHNHASINCDNGGRQTDANSSMVYLKKQSGISNAKSGA